MILKIKTNHCKKQGWRMVEGNEIYTCGFSHEDEHYFEPKLIENMDNFDLIDLRNPNRLWAPEAATHFLQIIIDRKKVYWVNEDVFLMNDNGKTIDKLY